MSTDLFRDLNLDQPSPQPGQPTDLFRGLDLTAPGAQQRQRPSPAEIQQYRQWIIEEATRNNLDPNILLKLANWESGYNNTVVSPQGAIGIMQLMPDTARGLGVNPNDAHSNIIGGAKYLREQLDAVGNNYVRALARYNAGPPAEASGRAYTFPETRNYIAGILGPSALAGFDPSTVAQAQPQLPQVPQIPQFTPSAEIPGGGGDTFDFSNLRTPSGQALTPDSPGFFSGLRTLPQDVIQRLPQHWRSLIPGLEPPATNIADAIAQMAWEQPAWAVLNTITGGATSGLEAARYARYLPYLRTALTGAAYGGVVSGVRGLTGQQGNDPALQIGENAFGALAAHLASDHIFGPMLREIARRYPQMGSAMDWAMKYAKQIAGSRGSVVEATTDAILRDHPSIVNTPAGKMLIRIGAMGKVAREWRDTDHVFTSAELEDSLDSQISNEAAKTIRAYGWNKVSSIMNTIRQASASFRNGIQLVRSQMGGGAIPEERLSQLRLELLNTAKAEDVTPENRAPYITLRQFLRQTHDTRVKAGNLISPRAWARFALSTIREAIRGDPLYDAKKVDEIYTKGLNFGSSRRDLVGEQGMRSPLMWRQQMAIFLHSFESEGYHTIQDPVAIAIADHDANGYSIAANAAEQATHQLVDQIGYPSGGRTFPTSWVIPEADGFRGFYLPAPIARAIDDTFTKALDPRTFRDITFLERAFDQTVKRAIVWLPFRHALNILARRYVAMGVQGLAPGTLHWLAQRTGTLSVMPPFVRSYGQVHYDLMTNGKWTRFLTRIGVRFGETSLYDAHGRLAERFVNEGLAADPNIVRLRQQYGPGDTWAARLYQRMQTWLWRDMDDTSRLWTGRAYVAHLVGADNVRRFEQGFLNEDDLSSLLASKIRQRMEISEADLARTFGGRPERGLPGQGIPGVTYVGSMQAPTTGATGIRGEPVVGPEELAMFQQDRDMMANQLLGQHITKIYTNYLRDDMRSGMDRAFRKTFFFYTWMRGVADLTQHLLRQSHLMRPMARDPLARMTDEALIRAVAWNFMIWPTVAASAMAQRFDPKFTFGSHTVVGEDYRPDQKGRLRAHEFVSTTPGGLADPEELARLTYEAVHRPDPGERQLGSYVVGRFNPGLRLALTLLTGGDPLTHRPLVPRGAHTIDLINSLLGTTEDYTGNFRTLFQGADPDQIRFLQFFGMPIYSRTKVVPSSYDIVDAIERGDYDKVLEMQMQREDAGVDPVSQATIQRMQIQRLRKQLGQP